MGFTVVLEKVLFLTQLLKSELHCIHCTYKNILYMVQFAEQQKHIPRSIVHVLYSL